MGSALFACCSLGLVLALTTLAAPARPAAPGLVATSTALQDFIIDRWTTRAGLPQSSVTSLVQADDGAIWVATFGGVARFDGLAFDVVDLTTHPELDGIRFVAVDVVPDGRLVLLAQDGAVYRGRGPFARVPAPSGLRGSAEGFTRDARGRAWFTVGDELLVLDRERVKLDRTLGGIRDMAKLPSAVWVIDSNKEHIAVGEARKLGIPVISILDTNCDPDDIDFPIPGNDDAIRSVTLLTRVIADAVAEGLIARAGRATAAAEGDVVEVIVEEPLAEWEQELLAGGGTAEVVVESTEGPSA